MKMLMRLFSISIAVFPVMLFTGFVSAQKMGDQVTCSELTK